MTAARRHRLPSHTPRLAEVWCEVRAPLVEPALLAEFLSDGPYNPVQVEF
jgi:hypothetical protein